MAQIKETIPFSFDEIYEAVEKKFTDQGYDVQEGSNTMQLCTAMAYMTSMLNVNTAVNINETLLTLARKRKMVLTDARVLGYEIEHIQSYQYSITVRFEAVGVYRLNKYTTFTSGDYTYYYLGDTIEDITVTVAYDEAIEGSGAEVTIIVIEGEMKTFTDYPEELTMIIEDIQNAETGIWAPQSFLDIPFTQVEDTYGIELFMTYYDENATFFDAEPWEKSTQFMIDGDTVLNKQYVRLDNIEYGTPRVYFKLGDVGKEVRSGSIININVLRSNGVDGAITDDLSPTELEATVINTVLRIQGAAEETITSIKENAPLFHNSANRVVTHPDYKAFAKRQSTVRYVQTWDGNNEYPKIKGHIWFSFVPASMIREINDDLNPGYTWDLKNTYDSAGTNYFIEDTEIQEIYIALDDYKIPTLKFHHRHPIYFDFEFEINIARYSIKTSKADVNQTVFTCIDDYFRDGNPDDETHPDTWLDAVETFGYEYFQSNMVKRIDQTLSDIMGFNITYKTSITLFDQHIIHEPIQEYDLVGLEEHECADANFTSEVVFHLGVPFEDLFELNASVVPENIPIIDTENIVGTQKMYTDLASLVWDEGNDVTTLDIKLTDSGGVEVPGSDDIVGKYRIFNDLFQDIEITLFVKPGTWTDYQGDTITIESTHTVGFDPEDFRVILTDPEDPETFDQAVSGITLDVRYITPNIRFNVNTIPRLKQVNFI